MQFKHFHPFFPTGETIGVRVRTVGEVYIHSNHLFLKGFPDVAAVPLGQRFVIGPPTGCEGWWSSWEKGWSLVFNSGLPQPFRTKAQPLNVLTTGSERSKFAQYTQYTFVLRRCLSFWKNVASLSLKKLADLRFLVGCSSSSLSLKDFQSNKSSYPQNVKYPTTNSQPAYLERVELTNLDMCA